jgi:hypothetical protein
MKTLFICTAILSVALLATPNNALGQGNAADPILKIFDRYEEKEGVESITISPSLLELMKNGRTQDKKTQEMIAKITGLRILSLSDDKNKPVRESLMAELQTAMQKGYEQIMKVKTDGERMELYVRHASPDRTSNTGALLIITTGDGGTVVMHLSGTIDKSMIDAVMNGEISFLGKNNQSNK